MNSEDKIVTIPYSKCVKMESPYNGDSRVVYHLFVDVTDVPTGIPTEVNPREVNPKTKVYKRIVEGLTTDDESFYVDNRGILISAKGDLKIDRLNRVVNLNVGNDSEDDKAKYGVLDGGHTYHAIINHRSSDITQFVHLEVVTKIDNIDELSSARNTSVQVSDKAIAELADKFEFVKEAIKNESYSSDVGYKQNESKRLDTLDFVRLMYMFNIKEFNDKTNSHPIRAYSGKAQVLKDYLDKYGKGKISDSTNEYLQLAKLLPDMTKLYDTVQKEMKEGYTGKQFGKVKGIEPRDEAKTRFYNFDMNYQISAGLIYPIVAAFRALLTENPENREYGWIEDPIKVWEEIKRKVSDEYY